MRGLAITLLVMLIACASSADAASLVRRASSYRTRPAPLPEGRRKPSKPRADSFHTAPSHFTEAPPPPSCGRNKITRTNSQRCQIAEVKLAKEVVKSEQQETTEDKRGRKW